MNEVKYYECAICKSMFDNKVKGIQRFQGSRKDVITHLHDEHNLKHIKNTAGTTKKDFGTSQITLNTIAKEIK